MTGWRPEVRAARPLGSYPHPVTYPESRILRDWRLLRR